MEENKGVVNQDPQANSTQNGQKVDPQFQDDTVQALLAKARKEAEERSHLNAQSGGYLPNVPPGTKEQISGGVAFEPVIQKNEPEPQEPVTKFSAEPVNQEGVIGQNDQNKDNTGALKNLRTYQGDVAEALKNQNASVFSITMAARKKAEKKPEIVQNPQEKQRENKNTWLALGSAVFLVIGLSILGGLYYVHLQNLPVPVVEQPKTLISFDKSTEVFYQGLTKDKFLSLVYDMKAKINVPMGEINYINIIKRVGTSPETMVSQEITANDFINLMKIKAPTAIAKAFDSQFMFGRYQGKLAGIFILAGINSYDNGFVGMLNWEKTMWNDLGALMSQNPTPVLSSSLTNQPTATTTSSSTALTNNTSTTTASSTLAKNFTVVSIDTNKVSSTTTFLPNPQVNTEFVDKVISNKDTRILQNSFGETVLVYGFVTKDLLLIASNEETFKAILDKAFAAQGQ